MNILIWMELTVGQVLRILQPPSLSWTSPDCTPVLWRRNVADDAGVNSFYPAPTPALAWSRDIQRDQRDPSSAALRQTWLLLAVCGWLASENCVLKKWLVSYTLTLWHWVATAKSQLFENKLLDVNWIDTVLGYVISLALLIDWHWGGLDPLPLCGADRNLVLSPGRSVDQHYKELGPGTAFGQWK